MVDVSRVSSHNKAANYIAKYLAKGQAGFGVLRALGFKRRWSRSNSWPSGQLRLAATARGEWVDQGFYGGTSGRLEKLSEVPHRLKEEKEGEELLIAFGKKHEHKMLGKKIKNVLDSLPAAV